MEDNELYEILEEIKRKEKEMEDKRKEIIKNGCPHTNKVERVGLFTRKHFLECTICFKQFWMDGSEIEI